MRWSIKRNRSIFTMISFGRQMKISVVTQVIQPVLRNFPKFENFRIFNEQWFKMSNFNSIKPFEKASEPLPDNFYLFSRNSADYIFSRKFQNASLLINHPTASNTKFYKIFENFCEKNFWNILTKFWFFKNWDKKKHKEKFWYRFGHETFSLCDEMHYIYSHRILPSSGDLPGVNNDCPRAVEPWSHLTMFYFHSYRWWMCCYSIHWWETDPRFSFHVFHCWCKMEFCSTKKRRDNQQCQYQ